MKRLFLFLCFLISATTCFGAFAKGFNFRATSGYVSDGANETYVIDTDAYPTTRNTSTFGWNYSSCLGDNGGGSRDRNNGIDRRIAGMNFIGNQGAICDFQVDLPSSGTYTIQVGFGDAGGNEQTNYLAFKDGGQGGTTLINFQPVISGGTPTFGDAAGNVYTAGSWPSNEATVTKTFTTSTFTLVMGGTNNPGESSVISHIFITQGAGSQAPVISPSTSSAKLGGTVQYSETAVEAGSWTCTATGPTGLPVACRGSINMTTGLYSAPSTTSTFLPQHTYGGIQILPNNDVYNVRIDSLPVSINNAQLLAAATQFGGAPTWDTDFPINFVSTAGASETMNFHFTPLNNGSFQVPSFPSAKAEHGWFSALQGGGDDHHVVMVDTNTALLSEFYQYYPSCAATAASVTGNVATITCSENPQANEFLVGMLVTVGSFTGADTYFNVASVALTAVTTTSISFALTHANASATSLGSASKNTDDSTGKFNSASGIKYYNTDYLLPVNNATDAAGMKLQGLILTLQEFERAYQTGGDINHAFRTTFGQTAEASSSIWPASTFAVDGGTIPFGARLRLKANYNIAGFSPKAQILLRALKFFGTFNVDGGNNFPMNADVTRWPSDYYQAIQDIDAVNISTSMEFVNETGIMVSAASEMTTYNREIIKFQRTSDLAISTVDVVLQGPAVNFQNDMQYFMAGGSAVQLGALNNYGGFTCTMSPSVGSLTSGCLYTPPASVTVMTTTTITATSAINSSMTAVMAVTIFPSTGIFALPSQTSNYTDSTGTTWNARTGTNWPDTMGCCACDNQASFPSATDNTLYKCYVTQIDTGGDFNQIFNVPNGSYQVLLRYGTQYAVGAQFIKLTVGGTEIYPNVDPDVQAGGQYRLFASTTTTVTNGTLQVGVFNMNDNGGPLSSLSIIPIASAVTIPFATIQGNVKITGKATIP